MLESEEYYNALQDILIPNKLYLVLFSMYNLFRFKPTLSSRDPQRVFSYESENGEKSYMFLIN